MKEKTIVITAHGQVITDKFKPSKNIVTTCKLGESHSGSLLGFDQVHIFDKPEYLYQYVLNGNHYLNTGEFWLNGQETYDVNLMPIKTGDPVKIYSWQKTHLLDHFTKLCRYKINDNNEYKNKYNITPFNIKSITLNDVQKISFENKDFSLLNSYNITNSFDKNYTLKNPIFINNHKCSLTYNKERTVNIIEYEEQGLFTQKAEWKLSEFISDIDSYSNLYDTELAGVESVVLKACLS